MTAKIALMNILVDKHSVSFISAETFLKTLIFLLSFCPFVFASWDRILYDPGLVLNSWIQVVLSLRQPQVLR